MPDLYVVLPTYGSVLTITAITIMSLLQKVFYNHVIILPLL